jgi:hypothetical protein
MHDVLVITPDSLGSLDGTRSQQFLVGRALVFELRVHLERRRPEWYLAYTGAWPAFP